MSVVGAAYHYWSICGEVSTFNKSCFWSHAKIDLVELSLFLVSAFKLTGLFKKTRCFCLTLTDFLCPWCIFVFTPSS